MSENLDVLIIGAGLSGIDVLRQIRDLGLGLSIKLIDNAPEIGGTWYWNRYPGATSDSFSHLYRFPEDRDNVTAYPLQNKYMYHSEIRGYLRDYVARTGLEPFLNFNKQAVEAVWDGKRWTVKLEGGDTLKVRYLITALGPFSAINYPDTPGLTTFQGELLHTTKWSDTVDFKGKRVAIIGNGASGSQLLTSIAPEAAQLISLQRTAQYVIPNGQRPLGAEERQNYINNWNNVWKQVENSEVGHGFEDLALPSLFSDSEEERNRKFEDCWQNGNGIKILFCLYGDTLTDANANEYLCEWLRRRISQIVTDPEKRRKLTPLVPFARRPASVNGFYEAFNLPHVDVINTTETPIEITEKGIRVSDGTFYELDIIVCATGNENVDGNYNRMVIAGTDGEVLKHRWANGSASYHAITVPHFPNMFMLHGPKTPLANWPVITDIQSKHIRNIIAEAERGRKLHGGSDTVAIVDTEQAAEDQWTKVTNDIAESTLLANQKSYLFANNVVGKKKNALFYFGGLPSYRKALDEAEKDGFHGLRFSYEPLAMTG